MWPVQKEGAGRRQKRGPQSSWESAEASWVADIWTVPCPVTRTELEDWPAPGPRGLVRKPLRLSGCWGGPWLPHMLSAPAGD